MALPWPFSLAPNNTTSRLRWRHLSAPLLDALFPPRCASCARLSAAVFCPTCQPGLKFASQPLCQCCGTTFDPLAFSAALCAKCRAHPPAYELARAALLYNEASSPAVRQLKYHDQHALAPRLAPLLYSALEDDTQLKAFQPTLLVPVPLHASRRRKRGYNQSALLAQELGLLLGIPAVEVLLRTRATPPQVGLKATERAKNVRGAFTLNTKNLSQYDLTTTRVLLIDDVFTTGATLHECARVLKQNKVARVAALTLTRQDF